MKLNVVKKLINIEQDKINVIVESNCLNSQVEKLIEYIKNYSTHYNKLIIADKGIIKKIDYNDIILFYSKGKSNYCKVGEKVYKIKKKLYELENINENFIRISKQCIININYVKSIDISDKSKAVVEFNDGTQQTASRRRIQYLVKYIKGKTT